MNGIRCCNECNSQINMRAEICPFCGVRQFTPAYNEGCRGGGGKNKMAAGLFAILLGSFGIHKFYLGEVGMGIIYLLFSWSVIPAVAGLVEGIIYLTMSDEEFDRKYGYH